MMKSVASVAVIIVGALFLGIAAYGWVLLRRMLRQAAAGQISQTRKRLTMLAVVLGVATALGSAAYGWVLLEQSKHDATFQGSSGEAIGGLLGYLIDEIGEPWFSILFVYCWFGIGVLIVVVSLGVSLAVYQSWKSEKLFSQIESKHRGNDDANSL